MTSSKSICGTSLAIGAQAGNVLARLHSTSLAFKSLQAAMRQLQRDFALAVQDFQDVQGRRPERQAGESLEALGQRRRAWAQDLQAAERRLMLLNRTIQDLSDRIEQLQDEINRLQFQELPQAQRADVARIRKELDDMRSALEATVQGAASTAKDDARVIQLKAEIKKVEVTRQEENGATTRRTYLYPQIDFLDPFNIFGVSYADLAEARGDPKTKSAKGGRALGPDSSGTATVVDDSVLNGLTPQSELRLRDIQTRCTRMFTSTATTSSPEVGSSSSTTADVQRRFADFMTTQNLNGYVDINAYVQWALREAYMSNTADLRLYAQKVKFYNDLKKMIRAEISLARDHLSAELEKNKSLQPDSELSTPFVGVSEIPKAAVPDENGNFRPQPLRDENGNIMPGLGTRECATKEALDNYIKDLEEDLNSVGDDAQLANVDLQNMMQRQQQTLQLMSNVAKMLHDTAMAIIRKIGG